MNILLTPARIGPVEIKNRIVMPPMTTRTADDEGFVTDDAIAYYMARVRGGTGLITVEMASPERAGRHRRREIGIYDDRFVPGLTRLVSEIHRGGAKASIQLGHAGGHTRVDICGETPIAPSAIPHPVYETTFETIVPEEMTKARIATTIAAYVAAARRAQRAGFDCVEIHAAHGYLISQFHAPFENHRTDEFGGSLLNRARFGLFVLRAVKDKVPGLTVIYRLSVEDYFPGGMPFREGRQVALWAAKAGADALHITAGHYRSLPSAQIVLPPMSFPDATFLDFVSKAAHLNRKAIANFLCKFPLHVVGHAKHRAGGKPLLDGLHHRRMAMSGHQRAESQVVIDIFIAIEIAKFAAAGFFHKDRPRVIGAIVARYAERNTLEIFLVGFGGLGRSPLESGEFFLQIGVHRIAPGCSGRLFRAGH